MSKLLKSKYNNSGDRCVDCLLYTSEFNPIVPNDTPENKAKNRRVDILVVEERESKTENKNNNVENK